MYSFICGEIIDPKKTYIFYLRENPYSALMLSIKHSPLYNEVLKELNYKFADVFIFEGFIVSEV
mgnify:CR=1 FL=1